MILLRWLRREEKEAGLEKELSFHIEAGSVVGGAPFFCDLNSVNCGLRSSISRLVRMTS